jgi:hypothetical protein
MANVHERFSSVEEACLDFEFSGDLLDVGDDFDITLDRQGAGGFSVPPGAESQSTRTLCWDQVFHPEVVINFLDGKAKLKFLTLSGSVTISSVTVTVSGIAR